MNSLGALVLIYFTLAIINTNAYKILLYSPPMSRSHVQFIGRIGDVLAKAGHDVVTYAVRVRDRTMADTGAGYGRTINTPKLTPFPVEHSDLQNTVWNWQSKTGRPDRMFSLMAKTANAFIQLCEEQLQNDHLIDQLRTEAFDLAIAETYDPCGFGIFHLIGIKRTIAATASTAIFESLALAMGIPNVPSYVPSRNSFSIDRMSFSERLSSFFAFGLGVYAYDYLVLSPITRIFRQKSSDTFPHLEAVIGNASHVLVNSDEFLDFPRPFTDKIVRIAGGNRDDAKQQSQPLATEYVTLMNETVDGAVFISFGSVASSCSMPAAMKSAFLTAFQRFPRLTFLWKYELDDGIAKGHQNVITKPWFPQADLLGHPKMQAIIAHAGMNSIAEAIQHSVPMICVPLFSDTFRNANMLGYRGGGLIVQKDNFTAETLIGAIEEVVYRNRYRQRTKRLSLMTIDKTMQAFQQIDWAVKKSVGNGQWKSNAVDIQKSFIHFFLIDALFVLLFIGVGSVYVLV